MEKNIAKINPYKTAPLSIKEIGKKEFSPKSPKENTSWTSRITK
ncbi:MAG TPA: hypothetical protein ACQGQH_03805 [Xylella sp.]